MGRTVCVLLPVSSARYLINRRIKLQGRTRRAYPRFPNLGLRSGVLARENNWYCAGPVACRWRSLRSLEEGKKEMLRRAEMFLGWRGTVRATHIIFSDRQARPAGDGLLTAAKKKFALLVVWSPCTAQNRIACRSFKDFPQT